MFKIILAINKSLILPYLKMHLLKTNIKFKPGYINLKMQLNISFTNTWQIFLFKQSRRICPNL